MVKAIHYFKRSRAMDRDAFLDHWRTIHAALVRRVPGVRRYVQSIPLASVYQEIEPVYDGVAELWYDDIDAMRRIAQTQESRAALDDDANFMDLSTAGFLITDEYAPRDEPADPAMEKWIVFLRRRPGMEVAEFQRYWREKHGPLAATMPGVRRYVQSHVRAGAYRGGKQPRYDGVAELWLEDSNAMLRAAGSPEYDAIRADELNFLDQSSFQIVMTRESVVI
jgi:uncharacterized protein (TIGR02118 family)